MRRLFAVLFGMMVGGGLVYVAFEYHVVRTEESFLLVSKQRANLSDAYVDIRDWKASDWKEHTQLAQNLTADGYGHLAGASFARGLYGDIVAPLLPGSSDSKSSWWRSDGD